MIKIESVNLTKDNLIKIREIDNLFYKEEILTMDWYLERYNENHNGILLFDDNNCVGYLVAVPIKKELYNAITKGVITNDLYINPKMIINKSKYKYIVSSVILEEYRHNGYGKKMLDNLFQKNKGKYCVLTITQDGYNLASKCMKREMKLNDNVNVFTLNNRGL